MIRPLLALALMTSPALAQTETFSNYVNGLPSATTAATGDKLYLLQGGTSKSISPFAVGASGCATPFQYIPQAQWAAIANGTSTYDATANLNSMLAAGSGCYSFVPGLYNVTGALAIPSSTVIYGNGAEIKAPSAGWLLSAPTNFGILNINGTSNIWIYDLHLFGTTAAADANHTPKLAFLNTGSTNVHFEGNLFDNTSCEGIWPGTVLMNNDIFVNNNRFNNVGVSCFASAGLPAIQANWNGGSITGNSLINVGTAIGLSAAIPVSGNYINGCTQFCIGTGDGATSAGALIAGNTILITDAVAGVGCVKFGNGTNSQTSHGNICIITESSGNNPIGYFNQSTNSKFENETCIINSSSTGAGHLVQCFFGQAGAGQTVTQSMDSGNCIFSITGTAQPYCAQVVAGGAGRTMNAVISGFSSNGAGINSGIAYQGDVNSGGTLNAAFIRNTKDGGVVILDAPTAASRLTVASTSDINLAYSYDNYSGTPQKTVLAAPNGAASNGNYGVNFGADIGVVNDTMGGLEWFRNNGLVMYQYMVSGGSWNFGSTGLVGWTSGNANIGADTGLSRASAAVIEVGNGSPGDASGTFQGAHAILTTNVSAGSYIVSGISGVSCATVVPSTMVVTAGIVTHC